MTKNTDYIGSCHCGAIGYAYRSDVLLADWSIRACQCTFCRAHRALSVSDTGGSISFLANNKKLLQKYHFGLSTADFLLCGGCGIYIGAVINARIGAFGIVNLRALNNVAEPLPPGIEISYDNEDIEQRSTRRQQRWTPVEKLP